MNASGLGIEIGASELKVAALDRTEAGTWVLAGANRFPISEGAFSPEVVTQLQAWLKQEGFKKRPCMVGVSGRDLVLRYVHVPRVNAWRLAKLMEFDIEEMTRTAEEKPCYDYRILNVPSRKVDQYALLVAMARDPWIESIYLQGRKSRLGIQSVTPLSVALFRSFVKFGDVRSKETVVLVHLGLHSLDLAIVSDGTLYFLRNLSIGLEALLGSAADGAGGDPGAIRSRIFNSLDLTPGAQGATGQEAGLAGASQILAGIESAIKFCRLQLALVELRIDRYVLSGEALGVCGLREYLMKSLGSPVLGFDPRPQIEMGPATEESRKLLGNPQSGFQVALGLAQMAAEPEGYRLELLSSGEDKRRDFSRRRLPSYISMAATAVLLLLAIFLSWSHLGEARDQSHRLVMERSRVQGLASSLEDTEKSSALLRVKRTMIERAVIPGNRFFELLALLKRETPVHVFIEAVGMGAESLGEVRSGRSSSGVSSDVVVFAVRGFVEESRSDVQVILADYAAHLAGLDRLKSCEIVQQVADRDQGILSFLLQVQFEE
ncbi:MAG: hypothetical protein QF752_13645 [Planctomycetota bacterium]|nr:hypothetical protein [Planctomycetota bacterium]